MLSSFFLDVFTHLEFGQFQTHIGRLCAVLLLLLIENWIHSLGCCRNTHTTCNLHADRFHISICIYLVYLEMMHRYVRNLSCQSNIYVSWSTYVRLVPSNMFQPSSKILTERYKVVLLLWTLLILCVSCLSFSYCLVCSTQPCGQIQEKG